MTTLNSNFVDQASIYSDLNSLDSIRRQAKVDEHGAIKKAAKEFEAFFMNMMLKSMRQASEVIGEGSPMHSQQEKMFTAMMDEQMSVDLSKQSHFGIADLMLQQLSPNSVNHVADRSTATKLTRFISNPDAIVNINKLEQLKPSGKNELLDRMSSIQIEKNNTDQQPLTAENILIAAPQITVTSVAPSIESSEQVQVPSLGKPEKKALFDKATEFIATLLPIAQKAVKNLAVDPKLLIAQAALETGWGKYVMHDAQGKPGNNLFGIKADQSWSGDKIYSDTLEVEDQQFKKVNAAFRQYENLADSFADYVDFIRNNPRYQQALQVVDDAQQYVSALQSSGYATDPNYAEKILRIYGDDKIKNFEVVPATSQSVAPE